MKYTELKDKIAELGYKVSTKEATKDDELELVALLEEKRKHPEYQKEKSRESFFLSMMGR